MSTETYQVITDGPETLLLSYFHEVYCERAGRDDGLSLSYQAISRRHITQFEAFLGRPARLSDLRDESVASFLGCIMDRGYKSSTANAARATINAVWTFAFRSGHVDRRPKVPPVKMRRPAFDWSLYNEPEPSEIAEGGVA
jgi:site-specific recombinase XerD